MNAWKVALYSALILTALWLLAPSRSAQAPEPDVVEINLFRRGEVLWSFFSAATGRDSSMTLRFAQGFGSPG